MNFQTVKQALIDLLSANQGEVFTTVGSQNQKEYQSPTRNVTVYYQSGQFPKGSSAANGPVQHQAVYQILVSVSAKATADLAVLNNPDSTYTEITDALALMKTAADKADALWDEVYSAIWNILMSPANYDIGLTVGAVSGRWINDVKKDDPIPNGKIVTLTGSLNYSVQMAETPVGETLPAPGGSISTKIDLAGDDYEKTAVTTGG